MERRQDIRGFTPEIGDTIAYNPPHYKGLVLANIIGFSKVGLPIIDHRQSRYNPNPSPKTGFVIVR